MVVLSLEESRRTPRNRPADASTPVESPPTPRTPPAAEPSKEPEPSPERQFVDALRAEFDSYFVELKQLNRQEPDQVFATLSSISARLSEVRSHLVRVESRRLTALRTREVDPLLDEVDRQFRIHSRIQAVRRDDWEMAKGQM